MEKFEKASKEFAEVSTAFAHITLAEMKLKKILDEKEARIAIIERNYQAAIAKLEQEHVEMEERCLEAYAELHEKVEHMAKIIS